MSRELEVVESPVAQRVGEAIAYTLDTTLYGGSPTSVGVTLVDLTTGADVSGSGLSGGAGVSGDTITTPLVSVPAARSYRLTVQFQASGQTWRPFCIIEGVG